MSMSDSLVSSPLATEPNRTTCSTPSIFLILLLNSIAKDKLSFMFINKTEVLFKSFCFMHKKEKFIYMHIYMHTMAKAIMVSNKVYEELRIIKGDKSFSDVLIGL